MKSVIVGTAGHIDHGKTALVKALTGIDADRLQEEKRRGITIDLGFAHLELPTPEGETVRLGFVDVPGHERFVRNMLAGVGGIDLVLLVIAADDSIKPQTREHLDICRLLGVQRGITVITKADLANRETLDVVRLEIEEFLRGSFLQFAPILAVSALTGSGMDELKNALVETAQGVRARDCAALARLPIDRAFTMKGFGTVVTGTLVSGTISEGDEMEIFPDAKRTRIRSVQVHGESTRMAIAGQRTALNLTGIDKEELRRGMTLSPPSTLLATKCAEVSLSLLPSSNPLKDRARVHLHSFTAETVATIVLYEKKQISPGEEVLAQLRLAEANLLLPGDRFVIRQFSPVMTIGGGVILDASTPQRGMPKAALAEFREVMRQAEPESVLSTRIGRRGKAGLTQAQAVAETGWTPQIVATIAQTLLERKQIIRTTGPYISVQTMQEMCAQTIRAVSSFQQKNPLVAGIPREELREQMGLSTEVLAAVIEKLIAEKQLEVSGEQVRLPGRGVVLKDDEAESKAIIQKAFASAGLKVPALKEVLAGLKVDAVRAQKIVTLLLRDKVLVKVSDDLVFHQSALAELRKRMAAEKTKSPKMDVARFKDLTGVTRKYAIPLLEYLDRERVTRRVGNERVIL